MLPAIAGSATALPANRYAQAELHEVVRGLLPECALDSKVLERLFRRVGVEQRFLALPIEAYAGLTGFAARSQAFLSVALELGERAVLAALREAEVEPAQVELIVFTTVTGLSVPSLEARLMNRIGFPRHMKRIPMFGLGCLAGVAGVARTAEYLRAFPDHAAVFLSVELCSLNVQRDDVSLANLISSGLFGDGAAALVLTGGARSQRRGPRVLDSLSAFFPGTERTMGWDIVDSGFKVVLGPEVPELARREVPGLVDRLLARHGLSREHVDYWIVHPGGPAVMEGIREGLGLSREQLERTRRSLLEVGNMSSASVLFLLDEVARKHRPKPGERGVMIAMGPAFSAEAVLLQW